MALQAPVLWEIALDGIQICLCGFILLFLIRNRIKYKQLILKTPTDENSRNFSSEFMVEAVRQQAELAFNHILETIDKERQALEVYLKLRETQMASNILKSSLAAPRIDAGPTPPTAEPDAADEIYGEIESLADRGMSLAEISEKLNVPQGEIDLVLKLKRLSVESAKNKNSPQV